MPETREVLGMTSTGILNVEGSGRYPAIRQVKAWEYFAPSEEPTLKAGGRAVPGTGQVKDDQCGMFTAVAVCSSNPDHEKRPIQKSCNRLECPVCYTRVLRRNAEAVALRVNGYREALAGQRTLDGKITNRPYPPRSGTMSAPQSITNMVYDRTIKTLDKKKPGGYNSMDVQATFLEKYRYEAYKALELLGIDGAAVIIHFDRINDHGKELFDEEQPDMPIWAWIITKPNWRDLIYFSPHVHLLYYGTTMNTREFYEKSDGWTFKMIREADQVEPAAYYYLSHAPVIHGRLSVTYWGCLSPRKLKAIDEHVVKEEVLCETCGAVLVYASIDEEGHILQLTDHHMYRKRRVRTYQIVAPGPPGNKLTKLTRLGEANVTN